MLLPNCPPALLTHSGRTAPLPGGRPAGPRAARGVGVAQSRDQEDPVVTGAGEVGQRRVSVRHTRHRQNPVCSRCFSYTKKTKQTAVLDVTPVSNPTNTTDGFATTSVSL